VVVAGGLAHHLYFDWSALPDIEPFIRFELSTTRDTDRARGLDAGLSVGRQLAPGRPRSNTQAAQRRVD